MAICPLESLKAVSPALSSLGLPLNILHRTQFPEAKTNIWKCDLLLPPCRHSATQSPSQCLNHHPGALVRNPKLLTLFKFLNALPSPGSVTSGLIQDSTFSCLDDSNSLQTLQLQDILHKDRRIFLKHSDCHCPF